MTSAVETDLRLQILQPNLQKALSIATRAVSTKPPLAIVACVLLSSDRGQLCVQATNFDIAVTAWAGAKMESEGRIAVPAREFAALIGDLPPATVSLTVQRRRLKIACARGESQFATLPGDDFPLVPKTFESEPILFAAKDLAQAIARTAFAAATDDNRPVLTGVCIDISSEGVATFAAADGFRLAEAKVFVPRGRELRIVVPARSLAEVERLCGSEAEVAMRVRERPETVTEKGVTRDIMVPAQVQFTLADAELTCQLLQHQFPMYDRLIGPSATTARVNAQELLMTLRPALRVGAGDKDRVRLYVERDRVRVTAGVESEAVHAGEVDAQVDSPGPFPVCVAVNGDYLRGGLRPFEDGDVVLGLNGVADPLFLRQPELTDYLYLVQPMAVSWEE